MEKSFELELDEITSKLSSFYTIINRLPESKQFIREVKLNTLLEDKRIQFDIEDIKLNIYGTNEKSNSELLNFNQVSFVVKSLSFIIKNDIVEKITVGISALDTHNGKILQGLIEHEFKLKLKIRYVNGMIPPNGNFYVDIETEKPLD